MRDGLCYVRTIAGLKRIDVILRRVDADFVDPLELNSASRLGVPGLLEAIRGGGVSVLNMPGAGVLESRALMGFFPRLARTVLGETLKLPNIATWWCGQPAERALVEASPALSIATAFNTAHIDDLAPAAAPGLRPVADRAAGVHRGGSTNGRATMSARRWCGSRPCRCCATTGWSRRRSP